MKHNLPVICLMGPTAAGKTPLAIQLVQRFPCQIISVDSAMVYRDMDIGTAKPTAAELKIAPHRLINLNDPAVPYSAGEFRRAALQEIELAHAAGKIPLLVGGTMLYFRVLQNGLAHLPEANPKVRAELQMRAEREGWEAMHAWLSQLDPHAAERIQPRDSQRIQRALEVFMLTGKTITSIQRDDTYPLEVYHLHALGLAPVDRNLLHERIKLRFAQMLELGFVAEVEKLYARGDLTLDTPAIRSVGYKQIWEYLAGEYSFPTMQANALAATRQLAKRQMTWLRSWPALHWFESDHPQVIEQVSQYIQGLVRI